MAVPSTVWRKCLVHDVFFGGYRIERFLTKSCISMRLFSFTKIISQSPGWPFKNFVLLRLDMLALARCCLKSNEFNYGQIGGTTINFCFSAYVFLSASQLYLTCETVLVYLILACRERLGQAFYKAGGVKNHSYKIVQLHIVNSVFKFIFGNSISLCKNCLFLLSL